MNCLKCGKRITSTTIYCPGCGKRVANIGSKLSNIKIVAIALIIMIGISVPVGFNVKASYDEKVNKIYELTSSLTNTKKELAIIKQNYDDLKNQNVALNEEKEQVSAEAKKNKAEAEKNKVEADQNKSEAERQASIAAQKQYEAQQQKAIANQKQVEINQKAQENQQLSNELSTSQYYLNLADKLNDILLIQSEAYKKASNYTLAAASAANKGYYSDAISYLKSASYYYNIGASYDGQKNAILAKFK